ncbi:MAG: hypothetical protein ACI86M_002636, partial [Saprospiraceae bacterium]
MSRSEVADLQLRSMLYFALSTIQPFNHSIIQSFNHSIIQ